MIDLWIMDDSGEPVPCTHCGEDVRTEALNTAYKQNKGKRWTSRLIFRCEHCKEVVVYFVNWIPEFLVEGNDENGLGTKI